MHERIEHVRALMKRKVERALNVLQSCCAATRHTQKPLKPIILSRTVKRNTPTGIITDAIVIHIVNQYAPETTTHLAADDILSAVDGTGILIYIDLSSGISRIYTKPPYMRKPVKDSERYIPNLIASTAPMTVKAFVELVELAASKLTPPLSQGRDAGGYEGRAGL